MVKPWFDAGEWMFQVQFVDPAHQR